MSNENIDQVCNLTPHLSLNKADRFSFRLSTLKATLILDKSGSVANIYSTCKCVQHEYGLFWIIHIERILDDFTWLNKSENVKTNLLLKSKHDGRY